MKITLLFFLFINILNAMTFEEVYTSIFRFIEFYNNRRLHRSLKYRSPKMFIEGLNNGTEGEHLRWYQFRLRSETEGFLTC